MIFTCWSLLASNSPILDSYRVINSNCQSQISLIAFPRLWFDRVWLLLIRLMQSNILHFRNNFWISNCGLHIDKDWCDSRKKRIMISCVIICVLHSHISHSLSHFFLPLYSFFLYLVIYGHARSTSASLSFRSIRFSLCVSCHWFSILRK